LGCGFRALDQPLRQAKKGAEQAFAARHLAGIGLMVVSGKV
jgi:hypothetical protein